MGKNFKLLCLLIYLITGMGYSLAANAQAAEQSASAVAATDLLLSAFPDRRKEQFQTSFGYALFPYPYQIPGIGAGIGLVGGAMNIGNTHTDVYGIAFTGDVQGFATGVADIHLIPRADSGCGLQPREQGDAAELQRARHGFEQGRLSPARN